VYYHWWNKNRAKYCSKKCKYKGLQKINTNRIQKKGGSIFICKTCKKEFYRTRTEIARNRRNYCSFACRIKGRYQQIEEEKRKHTYQGRMRPQHEYIYVKSYDHPNRNSNNEIAQHRLVMEKHLGRYLLKSETVHHRNGIKHDNRIENLEVVVSSPHYGKVKCPRCNETFLIR
jgi:hypothetical protein